MRNLFKFHKLVVEKELKQGIEHLFPVGISQAMILLDG